MRSRDRDGLLEETPAPEPASVAAPEPHFADDVGGLRVQDVLGLQRRAGNQAVARTLSQVRQPQIQRVLIAGVDVKDSGGYPTWDWVDGKTYHFNMRHEDGFHITEENSRTHYYFNAKQTYVRSELVVEISDAVGTGRQKKEMKGKQEHKSTRRRWSELDSKMRTWFESNYEQIMKVGG